MVRVCQLNISGLSTQSTLAVDRLCDIRRVGILALQEVGPPPPTNVFTNMITFSVPDDRGVSLSVRADLKPQRIQAAETSGVGAVFAVIQVGRKPMLVGSVYRSPNSNISLLLDAIKKAWTFCRSSAISSLLVLGDLNARCINFGDRRTTADGKALMEFCDSEGCAALSPGTRTFFCEDGGSVIDIGLVFGDASIIESPWVDEEEAHTLFTGYPSRGHAPVFSSLKSSEGRSSKRELLDLRRADWGLWSLEIESMILENPPSDSETPQQLYDRFLQILKSSTEAHIPTKTVCRHSRPFWCAELSALSRNLREAQKRLRHRRNNLNREAVETAKELFKDTLLLRKNEWIHRKLSGLNVQQSTEFWNQYRWLFLGREENFIGCLEDDDGELLHSDVEKEKQLFESYFTGKHLDGEVFDEEHLNSVTEEYQLIVNEIAEEDDVLDEHDELNRPIDTSEVSLAISSMKTSVKAWDRNGIHPIMLKKLRHNSIAFLAETFTRCLRTGHWPWEASYVTFIKKDGKKSYLKPGSYRPITISSYVGKTLERIMDKRIKDLCRMNSIPDDEQEGFLPIRNTTRYLFKLLSTLHETRRRKATAFLLCVDFQKAFDSIPHVCLLVKLHRLGIKGKILRLLDNMLGSRKVSLMVNGKSGPFRACGRVGLPQGAVLSPILFILYIADLLCTRNLPENSRSNVEAFKFADDGSCLVFGDMDTCERTMTEVLNYIHNWCRKWRLAVNCERNKTEIIIIQPRGSTASPTTQLQLGGKPIAYVASSKVLGVHIDDKLSFMTHSMEVLKRCWFHWNQLSLDTRRMAGANTAALSLLFKTVITTKILYAAPVWLKNRLDVFRGLLAHARLKITGAQFHVPKPLSEMLAGTPPLDVLLETVTTKFVLKGLSASDTMTAKLLQIEAEPGHAFFWTIAAAKRYLFWKANQEERQVSTRRESIRTFALLDQDPSIYYYSKDEMRLYLCHQWDKSLESNLGMIAKTDPYRLSPAKTNEELLALVDSSAALDLPVVSRSMTRQTSSYVLDFIHGRSLRFQDFAFSYLHWDRSTSVPVCLECGQLPDSPSHKLFECEAVTGVDDLRQRLKDISAFEVNYHLAMVFCKDREVMYAFRELVAKIVEQSVFGDNLLV